MPCPLRWLAWTKWESRNAHGALRNDVGLSDVAAHFVLDLPQSGTTRQARAEVVEGIDELTRQLQDE